MFLTLLVLVVHKEFALKERHCAPVALGVLSKGPKVRRLQWPRRPKAKIAG